MLILVVKVMANLIQFVHFYTSLLIKFSYRTTGVQNDTLAVMNKWMISLNFIKVNFIKLVTSNKVGGFLSPSKQMLHFLD
jgi:hypothetical protein